MGIWDTMTTTESDAIAELLLSKANDAMLELVFDVEYDLEDLLREAGSK